MERNKLEYDRLWSDHHWETREVIRDAVSNSPCFDVDKNALMENQEKLGRVFGKLTKNAKAGEELTKALKEHINIAIELVTAAKTGKATDPILSRWQQNADEISMIYRKNHKRIPLLPTKRMMQNHLETTLAEALAIVKGDCTESYEKGEIALDHIRMMAQFLNNAF